MNVVYVLINCRTNNVDTATTNDIEAWASYRDMRCQMLQVFMNGNLIASIASRETIEKSGAR